MSGRAGPASTSEHLVPRCAFFGSRDRHAPGQFEKVRSAGKNGALAFEAKDEGVPFVKTKGVSNRLWDRDLALAGHACSCFHWASLLLSPGKDTMLAFYGLADLDEPGSARVVDDTSGQGARFQIALDGGDGFGDVG